MLFRLVRSADGIAPVRWRTTGAANPHTTVTKTVGLC